MLKIQENLISRFSLLYLKLKGFLKNFNAKVLRKAFYCILTNIVKYSVIDSSYHNNLSYRT